MVGEVWGKGRATCFAVFGELDPFVIFSEFLFEYYQPLN
jgi:hypothetical protein